MSFRDSKKNYGGKKATTQFSFKFWGIRSLSHGQIRMGFGHRSAVDQNRCHSCDMCVFQFCPPWQRPEGIGCKWICVLLHQITPNPARSIW